MTWADISLSDTIRDAVRRGFGIEVDGPAERLFGGEESASYRSGNNVVRIGPTWRTDEELDWCYTLAAHAAATVPEVVAPRRCANGSWVTRADDRPVSVWPLVEGVWADKTDLSHRDQAADLLARLHRALRDLTVEVRPIDSSPLAPTPDLDDPDLDAWLTNWSETRGTSQPLHGDFYRGNVLVRDGRFVALLDWDNAFVGPPEQELAWAAWEWTGGLDRLDLAACADFVSSYVDADGTSTALDDQSITQFIRGRLRWEVAYHRAADGRGAVHDAEYEASEIAAFHELRRFS